MILQTDIKVIPAILEKDWSEIEEKIKKVENIFSWIQIDISDGIFTPTLTWNNPQELKKTGISSKVDVHLMIEKPWKDIQEWLESPVSRITFHFESFSSIEDIKLFIQKIRQSGKEVAVALNLETPVEEVLELSYLVDMILFLSVKPGFSGQEFNDSVLKKINHLRVENINIKIGVDGGLGPDLVKEVVEAGANYLFSGSYIFSALNPVQAKKVFESEIDKYLC